MKTCSKCKRELPEAEFVKSPRYRDGYHPHCFDCRKAYRDNRLKANPLCKICNSRPHTDNHPYCYECMREADKRTQGRPPKFRRDVKNTRCSFCKINPRLPYHNYCMACKLALHHKWEKAKGGKWAMATANGTRYKLIARAYVNHQVQRGKLTRQPCEVCGCLETQAHHNTYEDSMDIRWLCKIHHDALHRWLRYKRKQLTAHKSV